MNQLNLEDNLSKLQENLVNHIDQEGNKILSELTRRMTRLTSKFKSEVNKRFTLIYAEKVDLQTKKKTIVNIKGQVENNIKYLRKCFQMVDSEELGTQFRREIQKPSAPLLYKPTSNSKPMNPVAECRGILENGCVVRDKQALARERQREALTQQKRIDVDCNALLCALCKRKFRNLTGLTKHMRMTHRSAVVCTYKCIHCKSLHSSADDLARHLIFTHGEQGFMDRRRRRFYVETQSQQIFYEIQDLKEFIKKSDIFNGFNEQIQDECEISDSDLAEILE